LPTIVSRSVAALLCLAVAYAGAPHCKVTKAVYEWLAAEQSAPEQAFPCHQAAETASTETSEYRDSSTNALAANLAGDTCHCDPESFVSFAPPLSTRRGGVEIAPPATPQPATVTAYAFAYAGSPYLALDLPPPRA
jgi:hypothetical protein